jgi:hypothetical protein
MRGIFYVRACQESVEALAGEAFLSHILNQYHLTFVYALSPGRSMPAASTGFWK